MTRWLAVALVCGTVAVAGCGGGPSSPSSTSLAGGATVNGSIVASSGLGSALADAPQMSGMTVTVAGTNLSAQVDGSNRFTLRGVPAGNAQLQFSSSTVNATLGLPDVQSTETISLAVSVTSTSATIESLNRTAGGNEQLEGRVESLPPTTPANSLIVAGRPVTTNSSTQILQGSTAVAFSVLAIGQRVHVTGTTSGGSLLAGIIQIQNTNVDIPEPINGIIESFSGTSASFQFEINDRLIKGDATTEFFGGSAFSDIADGKRAEVKGSLRDGYVFATRMKVETTDDGGSDDSASIEGTLTSKTGSIPTLTLVVAGTTVKTTSSTEVRRRGDVQDLSVLALNMTLHVVGARQSDGSIIARMIQIKDDAVGGLVEIEGSLGGLQGTCPAISFKVNGYDVTADGSTTFSPAPGCSALRSGNKVKVKGTLQSGGVIKATSIEKL